MADMIIPGEMIVNNAAKELEGPDLLNVMVAKNNLKWGRTFAGGVDQHTLRLWYI